MYVINSRKSSRILNKNISFIYFFLQISTPYQTSDVNKGNIARLRYFMKIAAVIKNLIKKLFNAC